MFNYIKNIVNTYKSKQVKRYEELSKDYLEKAVEAFREHDEELYDEYFNLYCVYRDKAIA